MDGVGSAVLAPLQNTAGAKPAGDSVSAPQKSDEKTKTSPVTPAELDPVSQPIAPEGLNALIKAQAGEEESAKEAPEGELTPEEEKEVQDLKKTDAEVRAHEAAHKTAGGGAAGSVSFETVTGPDGREYAVSGEVQIDVSPAGSPDATIRKMDQVIRAALAPADPSSQDRAVAAQAQQAKLQAQQEASQTRKAEQEERSENNGLGLLSQLKEEDSKASNAPQPNLESDSASEIVSILFGN